MTRRAAYLRFPSIRADLLSFVADDDIWLATVSGGDAYKLTSDRVAVWNPRISPDGQSVGFLSRRAGEPEAFVVGVDSGEVRRLTWWADQTTNVIGWSPDGRLIVLSANGEAFRPRTWAFAIDPASGDLERLDVGPVSSVAHGASGEVVVGVCQARARGASWKRYRGGTAGRFWADMEGSGEFRPFLSELEGQLEDPGFCQGRVVFVSDHEGYGNVYSVSTQGQDLRRHTDQAGFYARAMSTDGSRVVYQCAGELWLVEELSAESAPRRLEPRLRSAIVGRQPRRVDAAKEIGEFDPDAGGRGSAVELSGALVWLPHRDGAARVLSPGSSVRARTPSVTKGSDGRGDGSKVVWVSDVEGDDSLVVSELAGNSAEARTLAPGQVGRVLELATANDGRKAAVATHDGRLLLVDLAVGSVTELGHTSGWEVSGLSFSPDDRWLAWAHPGPGENHPSQIKVADLSSGEVAAVTPLRFRDTNPVFSLDGKYLAFLSTRTFDPVYDELVFDMSFQSASRPYLVTLKREEVSPFDPREGGREPASGPAAEAHRHDGGSEDEKSSARDERDVEVAIDFDGIAERVTPFPVESDRYENLQPAKGGVIWEVAPPERLLGDGLPAPDAEQPKHKLVRFDLSDRKETTLAESMTTARVTRNGAFVVVRDDNGLRVVSAERAGGDHDQAKDDAGDTEVDLSRISLNIDPPAQWQQMFDEAGRLMRDHFWVEDMSGVDWDGMLQRYRPLVSILATRHDLSELLWEVSGELGTSHAYEMPPAEPVKELEKVGHLGADMEADSDGIWRINRIVESDPSSFSTRSPLLAAGARVEIGDAIVAVGGQPVEAAEGPWPHLVGTAGKPLELTLQSGRTGERRQVVVVPLESERRLRYQSWVAGRRRYVHERTGGKVGYVHVPDMMAQGWADFHRDLTLETMKDALVVDVRNNGGGHTSPLVLEKLSRGKALTGWATIRHGTPETYPPDSPRGPLVEVVDEFAGSDGDIVTANFKALGLGPIVGKRTWGGVIGIDGRYHLADGTVVTQPRYSFWFYDGGWEVENHGVDPDLEVDTSPQDWVAGRDPQLDEGIRLVTDLLAAHPAATPPDPAARPSKAPPSLPPRPGVGVASEPA